MAIDKEKELERVTRLSGFRYGTHEFFAEVDLEGLKERNDRVEANHLKGKSHLDVKTEELLHVATNIAARAPASHIQVHIHAAHKAGATPEEIMEVVNRAARWVGQVARHNGLEAWRATFRPDIGPIDRIVELR